MSDKGLTEFIDFKGLLSTEKSSLAVTFQARIDDRGEIDVKFPVLPLNEETAFIRFHSNGPRKEVGYFRLTGAAEDGMTFESDHVHVAKHRSNINNETCENTFELGFVCGYGTFQRSLNEVAPMPQLIHWLKGFECFRRPHAKCRLGTVVAAGPTKLEDPDKVAGWIAVQAKEVPSDLEAWRSEAENLLNHVRRVMSFAASIHLKSPLLEFTAGEVKEITVYSQGTQHPATMRTFHILELHEIFEAAVSSFFDPPVEARDLFFAFEWFAMPSTYNEVRLVNAMTTLESLVASNVKVEEAFILPPKDFEKSRRVLRKVIRQCLEKWPDEDADATLQELNEKLGDLNRRSFRRKLYILARRWGVPLDDIPESVVSAAIKARNAVIHSGHHYAINDDERLWEHMTVVREVAVRFLLTALGFRGQYVSHLGGRHHASFPPPLRVLKGADAPIFSGSSSGSPSCISGNSPGL